MNAPSLIAIDPRVSALARTWGWRTLRFWPAAAGLFAALMLATAHAFEAAGYEPCALCLRQREAYWGVLAIAAASSFIWWRAPDGQLARAVGALLGAAFLTGAIVAAYHAGVEWKFWPGPATCTAGAAGLTSDDILGALGRGGPVVLCDEAAWRDPVLRLSMAGWNAVISTALAAISALAVRRGATDAVGRVHG